MGCDIHLFTERKRTIYKVEKWVSMDHFKLNPYYGIDEDEPELECVSVYSDRNYSLFAILAGVMNYGENTPISEPKGLPNDCCEVVQKKSDYDGSGGHTHSYFTLAELKAFRKDNLITKYSGMVSPNDLAKIEAGEMPDSWCQSTNIESYVYKEWEYGTDTLKPLIEAFEERKKKEFWIWGDEEHPELDDQIRIVFWFDN